MIPALLAIPAKVKALVDLWTTGRAGYLDRLNTDYSTGLKDAIVTTNTRIDKAMSTRLRAPTRTQLSGSGTYNLRDSANNNLLFVILVGGGSNGEYGTGSLNGGGGGGGETVCAWLWFTSNPVYVVGAASGSTRFGPLGAAAGGGAAINTNPARPAVGGGAVRLDQEDGYWQYAVSGHGIPGGGGGNLSTSGGLAGHWWGAANSNGQGVLSGGNSCYGIGGAVNSAGSGYGAGGGGATPSNQTPGAGTAGTIIVFDYGNVESGN